MKDYNNNVSVLHILWKWKYHIAIITGIAIVLAIVFSSPFFITPKYKSNAVVYPANISSYSDESETEQMLQILQSKDIKDSVIKKFDLARHYDLDSNYKYFYTTLYYEYGQNVDISKTPYESVEIIVMDEDPVVASEMVQAILDFYDEKVRKLHNQKYLEVIRMYHDILRKKKGGIDSLQIRLSQLSKEYGLIDYDAQALEVTKGHLKTIMGANKGNIDQEEVDRLMNNMKERGGELITLVESLRNEARTYADLKVEYENAIRFYTDVFTYSNIVTHPYPSDKKSYPVRWLIVAFTGLSVFFLSAIIIVLIERYRLHFKEELAFIENKDNNDKSE
ncbi:MAG: Wzz/FepE/Etk N-terminal domain-containing protein [Bacteroidales bacterium]